MVGYIKKIKNQEFNYPFRLDVMSLYTSIPPQDALSVMHQKISENLLFSALTTSQINHLLDVILKNVLSTYRKCPFPSPLLNGN